MISNVHQAPRPRKNLGTQTATPDLRSYTQTAQIMQKPFKQVLGLITGVALLGSLAQKADAVTVTEIGAGTGEGGIYITSTGIGTDVNVFAGLINLQVNGVSTVGFCIDPYHWSVSGPQTDYNMVSLTQAPKPPGGPMDLATATRIEQLWAQYFTQAQGNNGVAAGLQIAIWELVTGTASGIPGNTGNTGTFVLNGAPADASADANADLTWLKANPNAPAANLVGLTSGLNANGGANPGQDYVIQSVPDGGTTVILLGCSLFGLCFAQRKLRVC